MLSILERAGERRGDIHNCSCTCTLLAALHTYMYVDGGIEEERESERERD